MKFLTKQTNLVIVILLSNLLNLIQNAIVGSKNSTDEGKNLTANNSTNNATNTTKPISLPPGPDVAMPETFKEVNHLLNRGYSLLVDQSSLLERPASCLGKFDVFNYNLDIEKIFQLHHMPGDLLINLKPEEHKGQRTIKEYTVEELMYAQDFAINGTYKVPNSNYLYQRGRSVRKLHQRKTILYYHEKVEFSIEINNKTDFPKLHKMFLADALYIFNKPEISDFANQEDYLRDAFAFLYKYGTHYLKKTKWGSRSTFITELALEPTDLIPSNSTPKTDTNIVSGRIGIEADKDKSGKRFFDFDVSIEIGNCFMDTTQNVFKNCDKNSTTKYSLIGYDVDPLFNLFNPADIKTPLALPDKSVVSPDQIQNIHKNLKNLIENLENALFVKNSVVHDLIFINNLPIEDVKYIGCLEEPKTKRYYQFKTSLFGDEHKVDKLHPLYKLNPKDFINYYDLSLINKRKFSSYGCLYKKFNLEFDDIFSPQLYNREFVNDVKLCSNSTFKANNLLPNGCVAVWAGKSPSRNETLKIKAANATENIAANTTPSNITGTQPLEEANTLKPIPPETDFVVNYVCLNRTTNFFDPKIVTDIKVKIFPQNKCSSFEYNDRKYECICDYDLVEMTGKKDPKIKRFICFSRKQTKVTK